MNCPFCNLDKRDISNTIIEETSNFLITPSKGSFCNGYLLIIPKQHLNSMNELSNSQKEELMQLIRDYREKFHHIYNRYPIFFEHGSSLLNISQSSSSITHAHIHIVNHNFSNEEKIISELNLEKISETQFFENQNKNYISYISPDFNLYISYNFKPTSQQMRIYIAQDLNISNNYNWKYFNFDNNIISTIKNFK